LPSVPLPLGQTVQALRRSAEQITTGRAARPAPYRNHRNLALRENAPKQPCRPGFAARLDRAKPQ